MLPKLHKRKLINEIIQKQKCEHIITVGNIIVVACPIVAGTIYHTSSISKILHIIMKLSLATISRISKDLSISKIDQINTVLKEPHLVLVILNRYILKFDMIFFIQKFNNGLKNCKMIYRYCKVLITNVSLKASQLFQNSIIFT